MHSLGELRQQQGRLTEAYSFFTRAIPVFRQAGNRLGESVATASAGEILAEQGELSEARETLTRALQISRTIGSKHYLANVLDSLGMLDYDSGHCKAARDHFSEAMNLRTSAQEPDGIALSKLNLARVSLCERNTGDAERLAEEAGAQFGNTRKNRSEAPCWLVAAQAMMNEQRWVDARIAIGKASTLFGSRPGAVDKLELEIVSDHEKADTGRAREAVRDLQRVVQRCVETGSLKDEVEARETLALAELRAGNPKAAEKERRLVREIALKTGLAEPAEN